MKQITENLWQGSIDPMEDGTLPDFITAVVAVGNGRRDHPTAIVRHLPLIEMLINWKVIKQKNGFLRMSSRDEVIAAIELVNNLIECGHKVYLHCDAGVCRSVGIAAAYLLRSGRYETLEEAYSFVSGGHTLMLENPFDAMVKRVCSQRYWTKFEIYIDPLHGYRKEQK
jgi:hypothetical protein